MKNFILGFVLGMSFMCVLLFTILHARPNNSVSNNALNNPKYKIDTTMAVTNGDTVYTYKFTRK